MRAAAAERLPVSIITGYLGSGKTTLLNRLLAHPRMARAAVIVNEFGEIGLDHLLIATPSENTVLLASGCICCTVRGDLVDTLRDLERRRGEGALPPFDRVIIETTGLADPVPILQTLITDEHVAPRFGPDSVVTLVDAIHGAGTLDRHPEAVKQVALADRLLVSKCDSARERGVAALERRLARLNPGAQRHRVARGDIEPALLFGAGNGRRRDVRGWLAFDAHSGSHHPRRARIARHDRGIDAFALRIEQPITRAGLMTWLSLLASLRGANLLRVKGVLNVQGRPVAVHAVQTLIDEPVELAEWPDEERRSRLVFITKDMDRAELERTLPALGIGGGAAGRSGALDPRAYARFVEAARGFR